MKLYKIRNINTGMFSTGGINPTYSSKGKIWKQLNHVRTHITLIKDHWNRNDYSYRINPNYLYEIEIVEFNVVEAGTICI